MLRFLAVTLLLLMSPVIVPAAAQGTLRVSNSAAPAPSASSPDTAVAWVAILSNHGALRGQLPKLLAAEIAKAKALGRTPFIEIGALWCGPCKELEASLQRKEMIDAFSGSYVIHLDANEWDVDSELKPLGFVTDEVDCNVLPFLGALDKRGRVISQMDHDIHPAVIKKFIREHLWQ